MSLHVEAICLDIIRKILVAHDVCCSLFEWFHLSILCGYSGRECCHRARILLIMFFNRERCRKTYICLYTGFLKHGKSFLHFQAYTNYKNDDLLHRGFSLHSGMKISLQCRRVQGLVVLVFLKVEGFEVFEFSSFRVFEF